MCRLPANREAAVEWYTLLSQLLARKKGLAVVASMSNLALDLGGADEAKSGELTVVLQRKLGMSINKLGSEIVIAELEPDGAAAACGLLSVGDALEEVNGTRAESCRQTIKLLMQNPSGAQVKLFSKVVHGGWMHKLGEGLGGWTTRYFTLTYEMSSAPPRPGASRNSQALDAKKERPRASSIAADPSATVAVRLTKASKSEKIGLTLAQDAEGRVVINRLFEGYLAARSASLQVGDELMMINGKPVASQASAYSIMTESQGDIELRVRHAPDVGCWMLRYFDGKNAVSRTEKGCIMLGKDTVREINKYTLQDEAGAADVPRVGLYILQDERCWELLPPEEELDMWVSKLQLAVFGQEVIAAGFATEERAGDAEQKVADLKGAHFLTLQQQYGLMLATFKDAPKDAPSEAADAAADAPAAAPADEPATHVHIMSLEMDGAGACSGLLSPDDRILEVDGVPTLGLQQVTAAFRESKDRVRIKVASRVVHGGFLLKKGDINAEMKMRWFVLSDEADGSVLRHYDGRNSVTRVLKGEIKVNPTDVLAVRHFTYEGSGERTLGVRLTTPSRVWEVVSRSPVEARHWVELLSVRARRNVGAQMAADGSEEAAAAARGAPGPPQSTRL